jgi:hypothetical protein
MDESSISRPKRGRPCQPEERVRSERVVTFLTKDEYAYVSSMAKREGLSISGVSHQLLIQSIQRGSP